MVDASLAPLNQSIMSLERFHRSSLGVPLRWSLGSGSSMNWDLGFAGWFHLLFFGLLIPLGAFRSRNRVRDIPVGSVPRHRFPLIVIQLLAFLTISVAVAWQEWIWIFVRTWPKPRDWLLALVMLTAALLFMRTRWRRAVQEHPEIISLFAPRNGKERAWWVLVALSAGVGEEISWRCVQFELLRRWLGDPGLAVVVCSVQFAVAHAIQGWKSMLAIIGFAAGFHALVLTSGSVYTAIVVHFVYDMIAGLIYGHLLDERDQRRSAEGTSNGSRDSRPPSEFSRVLGAPSQLDPSESVDSTAPPLSPADSTHP